MAEIRKLKKLPKLDMNPMVDMAFLLVSFFMMTTTFKTDSPAEINLPESHSKVKIPQKNMAIITVSKEGRIFFGIDNKFKRAKMLDVISKQAEMDFTAEQRNVFSLQSSFGTSIDQLADFLDERSLGNKGEQLGIPADSTQNELKKWLLASRISNPSLRYSIHADEQVPYPKIHQCIESLRDLNITRFNLITLGDDSPS
jgi:biopolymer transport protein ExbD